MNMSEENNYEIENSGLSEQPEEQLSFADKVTGIFVSPGKTLASVSKFLPKSSDWLIPLIIMIIVAMGSTLLYQSNESMKAQMLTKQSEAFQKNLQEEVDKGKITSEEADTKLRSMAENMQKYGSLQLVFSIIGIIIGTFIFFLLASLVFFLISKFALKGEGNFNSALSAYGFAYYIVIIQSLLGIIISMATNKLFFGLSLANFVTSDIVGFKHFLLSKLDPFTIWFYIVLGISYAKMFKSENSTKYIISFLLVWVVISLFFYYLSTLSPLLQGFAM
jgi:hypothetical protein